MLTRLRHDAVIGRDDQQRKIEPAGTRHHGVDEALVPGYVNEAEYFAVRKRHVGVTELDRDAAFLLLFEAVGVHTGQGAHERRLAVVDVTCGANDHPILRAGRRTMIE